MATGGQGDLGGAQFTIQIDTSGFEAKLQGAEATAKKTADTIGKELSSGSQTATRGLLQLGYALDDLQYGFHAIANNIPGIVMGLGLGTGVAGAAAIAATAVNQLINHWSQLSDLLQSAWTGDSVQQLTELREKAEAAAEAFERLSKAPTKAQAEQQRGMAELFKEGPFGNIFGKVVGAIAKDPALRAVAEKAAPGGIGVVGPGAIPVPQKNQAQLDEEAMQKNREKAKELIGKAAKGDRLAIAQLGRLVPELKADLDMLTPEGQEALAQKRLELQGGRNARKMQQKMDEEQKKLDEAERKEWLQGVQKAQKQINEEERHKRMFALQDQREELEDQKRWLRESMKVGPAFQGDFFSYIGQIQKSASEQIPKQQLDKLAAIDKGIKAVEDAIKKERRAAVLGP